MPWWQGTHLTWSRRLKVWINATELRKYLEHYVIQFVRYLPKFSAEYVAPNVSFTLKMEAGRSSETLVNIYHTTRHIPMGQQSSQSAPCEPQVSWLNSDCVGKGLPGKCLLYIACRAEQEWELSQRQARIIRHGQTLATSVYRKPLPSPPAHFTQISFRRQCTRIYICSCYVLLHVVTQTVHVNTVVFRNLTPYSKVKVYRRFRGT
jgi:hypothetical protein